MGAGRSRAPTAPPAWVWAAAIGLAAACLAATVPGWLAQRRDAVFVAFARERLAALATEPREPGTPRVVAFGTSLLRNATFPDTEMERFAAEEAGARLRFVRLVRVSARVDRFIPLFEDLFASEPDVLLWEWSMLTAADYDATVHRAYREPESAAGPWSPLARALQPFRGDGVFEHQAYVLRAARGAVEGLHRKDQLAAEARRQAHFDCRPYRTEAMRRRTARIDPRRAEVPAPVVATLDRFLGEARARGIRVVFLDVPIQAALLELAGPAARRRAAIATIERWVERGDAAILRYPERMEPAAYCELAHMSRDGQRRYAAWLARELGAMAP